MVRYLETAGQLTPEKKLKAEQVLRVGYQKLLSFQNNDGGFGWFAGRASDPFLTAYGLMQLGQMRKLISIDPRSIERAVGSLRRSLRGRAQGSHVAYALWALIEANFEPEPGQMDALSGWAMRSGSVYHKVLALQSLLATQPDAPGTRTLLDQVARLARHGKTISWTCDGRTLSRGYGRTGDIEATALATLALFKGGRHADLAQGGVDWLIQARGPRGLWGSTQSTVLTLMTLLKASVGNKQADAASQVRISVNGRQLEAPLTIQPAQHDVVHTVDLSRWARPGANEVTLAVDAKVPMTSSLVWQTYRRWGDGPATRKPLKVSVRYDRTRVQRGEALVATARLRYSGRQRSSMVILDIGVPPGFSVDRPHLRSLQRKGLIARFTVQSRQVTLYIMSLDPGEERDYPLLLRARYRVRAQMPATRTYEYYRPENRDRTRPARVEVY